MSLKFGKTSYCKWTGVFLTVVVMTNTANVSAQVLTATNLGCTGNLRTVLVQSAPDDRCSQQSGLFPRRGTSQNVNTRKITVTVPATQECVDSKVNVSSGQIVKISAVGQASYGFEGSPVNANPQTTPNGDRLVNGVNIGKKIDKNALYPGAIGALVGKIGATGSYFFIGANKQISFRKSGRLFVCYNDVKGSFSNNSGSYEITINFKE